MKNNFIYPNQLPYIHQSQFYIIDIRFPTQYRLCHLFNAINIPHPRLAFLLEKLPPHKDILLICTTGHESKKLSYLLNQSGYHAYSLYGGYYSLKKDN